MLSDLQMEAPEEYHKLLKSSMNEILPPRANMCFSTVRNDTRVFVNVCQWNKVPAPRSKCEAISMLAGTWDTGFDQKGSFSVTAVAVNSSVLEECCSNNEERQMLIDLIISFIEHHSAVSLSHTYSLLPDTNFQPGLKTLSLEKFFVVQPRIGDGSLLTPNPSSLVNVLSEKRNSAKPTTIANSTLSGSADNHKKESTASNSSKPEPSLVDYYKTQLKEVKDHGSDMMPNDKHSPAPSSEISGQDRDVVICSTPTLLDMNEVSTKHSTDLSAKKSHVTTPKHVVEILPQEGACAKRVQVTITLQGILTAASCQLDVTQEDLTVVAGQYSLNLKMPFMVDVDSVSAKFDKSTSILVVTLDIKP
ncbi:PREDICTED: PIH1 domain-containing protein 2-like isoform X1 [Priapulus caudatus]|uniref:PIH1 domain-containing protein 2 n=2 Tax=Priapulus caudatus TaxID=37621 RepID=A0ABM1DSR1_PRICU|nr:PREDICTED: PIH1 domain-containing protein 2-like isoform X1 [Priapulus caudatus]